jgi:hypothetical protein
MFFEFLMPPKKLAVVSPRYRCQFFWWRQKFYRFKFLALFCELGLKMLVPQKWQLLHVEKDDQVIQHNNNNNNNKTWETKEKIIRNAFFFEKLVNNDKTWRASICKVALDLIELFQGKIFVFLLGLVFNTP